MVLGLAGADDRFDAVAGFEKDLIQDALKTTRGNRETPPGFARETRPRVPSSSSTSRMVPVTCGPL